MTELVSVILPVYDPKEEWLIQSVESVLDQTYSDWELVIVDDESPKEAASILPEEITEKESVRIIRQDNRGFTGATRRAIEEAEGEYIAPIAQDDFWRPEKLEEQVERMGSEEKMVFTRAKILDDDNGFVKSRAFPDSFEAEDLFFQGNFIVYESLMASRDFLLENPPDESFDICSDLELWLRVWKDVEIDYIDRPLTYKRIHSSATSGKIQKIFEENKRVFEMHIDKHIHSEDQRRNAWSNLYRRTAKLFLDQGDMKRARSLLFKSLSKTPLKIKSWAFLFLSLNRTVYSGVRFIYSWLFYEHE